MKTPTRYLSRYALAAVLAAGLVTVASDHTQAREHQGKGPRASVDASAVCELKGADLDVTIKARNVADDTPVNTVITAWSITALARNNPGNWLAQTEIGSERESDLSLVVPNVITDIVNRSFSLCVPKPMGGFEIDPEVLSARALNAMTAITFGRRENSNVRDQRPKMMMCGDDPETPDVVEPGGFDLTPDMISQIATACEPPPPTQ